MIRSRRYVRQMPKIYGNLQKPKRDFGWIATIFKRIFWLGIIGFAVYAVSFSGWFSIEKVEVEGTVFTSKSRIAAEVPIGTNLWLLPADDIKIRILKDQSIASVAVLRGIPHSVKVVVQERKPSVLWSTRGQVYVLDNTGVAFAQFAPDTLPSAETPGGQALALLPTVIDTKGLPAEVNRRVVSGDFVTFVSTTRTQMAKLLPEVVIDRMEISDTTYDLTMIAKSGLQVQFNTLADPGVQTRNLARLIQQKQATLTSRVDLRIDRWAYVK